MLDANLKHSKSQYETCLRNWGIRKNIRASEWALMASQIEARKLKGKDTDVYLNGILLPSKRVQREAKRYAPTFTDRAFAKGWFCYVV